MDQNWCKCWHMFCNNQYDFLLHRFTESENIAKF